MARNTSPTPYHGLQRPEVWSNWVPAWDQLVATIDANLLRSGSLANRPADPNFDVWYYAEDEGVLYQFDDTAGWTAVAGTSAFNHQSLTDNPHSVTPAQIGATTQSDVTARLDERVVNTRMFLLNHTSGSPGWYKVGRITTGQRFDAHVMVDLISNGPEAGAPCHTRVFANGRAENGKPLDYEWVQYGGETNIRGNVVVTRDGDNHYLYIRADSFVTTPVRVEHGKPPTFDFTPVDVSEVIGDVVYDTSTASPSLEADFGKLSVDGNTVWHSGNLTPATSSDLSSHTSNTSNPHSVTASQVGAPTTANFTSHTSNTSNPHSVTAAQIDAALNADLTSHTSNTSNPHSVTAAQVGAPTSSALTSHTSNTSNPHSVTTGQIGAATTSDLSSHTANTSNPHSVTAAQTEALPTSGGVINGNVRINGSMFATLPDDAYPPEAVPTDFPRGYTTFRDASGLYPEGNNGIVETISPEGHNNALQYNWTNGGGSQNTLYYRIADNSTAWRDWHQFASRSWVDSNSGVRSDLTSHTSNTSNPHSVTAAQTGALPTTGGTITGDLAVTGTASASDPVDPDDLTTRQWVEANTQTDTGLGDHLADTDNPHQVTAAQTGAATQSDIEGAVGKQISVLLNSGSGEEYVKLSTLKDQSAGTNGAGYANYTVNFAADRGQAPTRALTMVAAAKGDVLDARNWETGETNMNNEFEFVVTREDQEPYDQFHVYLRIPAFATTSVVVDPAGWFGSHDVVKQLAVGDLIGSIDYRTGDAPPNAEFATGTIYSNDETVATQPWVSSNTTPASHASATDNPHSVTAAQTGAASATDFTSHTGNTSNPHSVTAAQVGALSTSGGTITGATNIVSTTAGGSSNPLSLRNSSNSAGTRATLRLIASTTANPAHHRAQIAAVRDAAGATDIVLENSNGSAMVEAARFLSTGGMTLRGDTVYHTGNLTASTINAATTSDLSSHTNNTSNPHGVTAAQIDAALNADLTSHTSNTSNPHGVTAEQTGAATATDLSSHTSSTSNPHSVTASQAGALPSSGGTVSGDLNVSGTLSESGNPVATKNWVDTERLRNTRMFEITSGGSGQWWKVARIDHGGANFSDAHVLVDIISNGPEAGAPCHTRVYINGRINDPSNKLGYEWVQYGGESNVRSDVVVTAGEGRDRYLYIRCNSFVTSPVRVQYGKFGSFDIQPVAEGDVIGTVEYDMATANKSFIADYGQVKVQGNNVWHSGNLTPATSSDLSSHTSNTSNPHSVTPGQIGAATDSDLSSHTSNTSNPHSVTASQVDAPTTSDFTGHTSNTSNPHSVTASQVDAPTTSDFTGHTSDTANPHGVTASQTGALPTSGGTVSGATTFSQPIANNGGFQTTNHASRVSSSWSVSNDKTEFRFGWLDGVNLVIDVTAQIPTPAVGTRGYVKKRIYLTTNVTEGEIFTQSSEILASMEHDVAGYDVIGDFEPSGTNTNLVLPIYHNHTRNTTVRFEAFGRRPEFIQNYTRATGLTRGTMPDPQAPDELRSPDATNLYVRDTDPTSDGSESVQAGDVWVDTS